GAGYELCSVHYSRAHGAGRTPTGGAANRRRGRRHHFLQRTSLVRVCSAASPRCIGTKTDLTMNVDTEVFVIGAGPAGLTAAYCLSREGRSVLVIEKDPLYVGGISRTVRYKNFLFDIGGHRFFSKSKEVVDLWREILPHDFIERPRLSRIYYAGKYYSY